MATRMLQRRGTAAEWAAANPILSDGEIGFERDTNIFKIGDGLTPWADLPDRFALYLPLGAKAADSELLDGLEPSAFMLAGTKKTVRVPHTFTISGEVKVPVGDTSYIPPFFVPVPAGQSVKAVYARHRLNSGTSATVSLNAYSVGGTLTAVGTGIVVTTTTANTDVTDVTLADSAMLQLVVTAVSGTPKNMSFTVYLDYEV